MKTNNNLLLMTDVYKLYHMMGYKPGTTKVYSYLCARSDKKSSHALFFGLQPLVKAFEQGVSQEDADEFFEMYEMILGSKPPEDVVDKINKLVTLGYIPLEIKAVPEGTYLRNKNVLATVVNTHDDFYWVGGFFESYLLKVWNTVSVATLSNKFKKVATQFAAETSDSEFLVPFQVHDFGYRGVSSEQTAELSGAAHLVNFQGTDTIPAVKFLKNNYKATGLIGASVPATEHSVQCSFGPTLEGQKAYVNHNLDLNPTGILSMVSDGYNYFSMLTDIIASAEIKHRILERDGKYVVRPDSGDPKKILCGDPDAKEGTPENLGTFRILETIFGATTNSKGFKELNSKIGVIYGDGMYYDRYVDILTTMKSMGYASTNLVIGIGGLLLQQHNRDDLGFAFKATAAVINGEVTELFKDPATDPGKRSHKGFMKLVKVDGEYVTVDQISEEAANEGELVTIFKNGKMLKEYTLDEVRARVLI